MHAGISLENIEVPLRLSGLKALHASWVVELYDYLTNERGLEIVKNGWKASRVTKAIEDGVNNLPALDTVESYIVLNSSAISQCRSRVCRMSL